jgi:hypothetical protein
VRWTKIITILHLLMLLLLLTACGNSNSSNESHDSVWKSAGLLADSARFPHIGVDDKGTVFAVWAQSNGFFANRFTVGSGWGIPQKIGESNAGWSTLRLVVSKSGHALAAWWNEEIGIVTDVEAVRYVPGSGWGQVENLGNIGVPKDIAIHDAGNAFIVTESLTASFKGLTIARYDQTTGWSNDRIGYIDPSTNNGFPKISVDNSGHGFVLWVEGESGTNNVYVSRRSGSAWEEPLLISSIAGGFEQSTNISIDGKGNAMALWGQQDSSSASHTYACRYTAAAGWNVAERVDSSESDSIDQYLTVDSSGHFYAVWTQITDTAVSTILSSQYSPGSGWQAPRLVGTGSPARSPRVATDSFGNIFAAWQQYDPDDLYPGDAKIYASRFTASSGWSVQRQLRNVLGDADAPDLAVDPSGRATIMWSQSTGSINGLIHYGVFFSKFE